MYIKNKDSIINGADACGGGMKKQGLVYGSDYARIKGGNAQGGSTRGHLATKGPKNYVFTLPGQTKKDCCGAPTGRTVVTYTSTRGRNMTNR